MVINPNSSHPGPYVRSHVIPAGMSVTKAAQTIGIGRPALSNFLNGKAALSPQMAAKLQRAFGADADDLMARQAAHDAACGTSTPVVSATTRTFVPPFLIATANDIENWADTHDARDGLAVQLRTLVNSTCGGLKFVDFPGRDDSQRPGWDGRVDTTEGNPWVPEGASAWEFGTNSRVAEKANSDYRKRTKETNETDRRRLAFVFVTPRRWLGKEAWLEDRRAEGQWRTVCAWDASDLEQWFEQSIPAQVWFEGCRGRNTRGVKSLDLCWKEWCADCQPRFTEEIFAEAKSSFQDRVLSHLRANSGTLLRIVADSRQEGLAFLAAVLSRTDHALRGFRDRVAVFTETGPLAELMIGSPGFIPVVISAEIEREWAQSGSPLTGFVVEPRTAVQRESVITLDPLSYRGFMTALSSMGLGTEEAQRLDRSSGRSLTILRRCLAQSEAIKSPEWRADEELAHALAPMALAGAWVADREADQYLMAELAGCQSYNLLERQFTRLRTLGMEDSPVWSVGSFRGVVSKVDALFGVHQWITEEDIDRFVIVAELVLSERDPALDLAGDEQWAAPIHGKVREISSQLRKGVAESLVLLAIHGRRLFGERFSRDPEQKVADLVRGLLDPLTADGLLSQSSNLPLYAEAAPGVFLEVFEHDLSREDPVVNALMRPTTDILFERGDRVHLLWAFELLAWRPEWLARVVALLGGLAELEPDDNLVNRPSVSLRAIFRSWMPQTAAPVEQRTAAFDILLKHHPAIAWPIATNQFAPGSKHGEYSRKPRWRDYAVGFGEPITTGESHAFVMHCVNTCLAWRPHTRDMLADLMGSVERFDSSCLDQLWEAIVEWTKDAGDHDRAWLRERIRVSARRSIRRNSQAKPAEESTNEGILLARKAFDFLEPTDPVWKRVWLFKNPWMDESWDEVHEDHAIEVRSERASARRLETVREVIAEAGHGGLLQLAFSCNAPDTVGWITAKAVKHEKVILDLVCAVLEDGDILGSVPHQSLVSGLLQGSGQATAIALVQRLWGECGEDVGVKLLCLCGFDRPVWSVADSMGVAHEYWTKVQPSWGEHTDDDLNHAVTRLLEVGRPGEAFDYAHLDWGRVESEHIRRILLDLPTSEEPSQRDSQLDAYTIQQAFKVLNERNVFSQSELAQLEFLYLDFFWYEEGGVPNLEKEIEENPDLFCQAITVAYRREDDTKRRDPTEEESRAAEKAHRLLDKLTRLPGHDTDGILQADKLTDWVLKAQDLCEGHGRKWIGDEQIGRLLGNAPTGDDDVWPCVPVRETLETVLNEDVQLGFQVGRRNSRGVHLRTEGGTQERELAAQYEEWAKACDYTYPKVATALRGIASAYENEARWHDQQSAVQRRLGY